MAETKPLLPPLVRWRLYERTHVPTNGKKQGSSRARVPFHLDASSGMTKWAGAACRGSRHATAVWGAAAGEVTKVEQKFGAKSPRSRPRIGPLRLLTQGKREQNLMCEQPRRRAAGH